MKLKITLVKAEAVLSTWLIKRDIRNAQQKVFLHLSHLESLSDFFVCFLQGLLGRLSNWVQSDFHELQSMGLEVVSQLNRELSSLDLREANFVSRKREELFVVVLEENPFFFDQNFVKEIYLPSSSRVHYKIIANWLYFLSSCNAQQIESFLHDKFSGVNEFDSL